VSVSGRIGIRWAGLVLVLLATLLPAAGGCRNPRQVEHSVPSLVKTLKEDKDPNMRYWAAESLGKFGPEAAPAVPDLVAALKDESAMVRMGAAYALGEIGSADAVPPLQDATKDSDKQVRDAAASALQQIRKKGKKK
jgi:HEAT repeat protein